MRPLYSYEIELRLKIKKIDVDLRKQYGEIQVSKKKVLRLKMRRDGLMKELNKWNLKE